MGLAASQVRLLSLTRRKADIELNIQMNSKRKQALTRKSTELSQSYYSKLRQTKIQYATSDGYENVNYDYIMGKTNGITYDTDFLQEVFTGSGNIPKKTSNAMILTDQYGRVVLNDQLALIVAKTQAAVGGATYSIGSNNFSNSAKVAEALKNFIHSNAGIPGYGLLDSNVLSKLKARDLEDSTKMVDVSTDVITKMVNNGGYMEGGTIYVVKGTEGDNPPLFVSSKEKASNSSDLSPADYIQPQDGYNYKVYKYNGAIFESAKSHCMFDASRNEFLLNTESQYMKYLGNLVSYFGPMLSAAMRSGMTTATEVTGILDKTLSGPMTCAGSETIAAGSSDTPEIVANRLLTTNNTYVAITDRDGITSYWERVNNQNKRITDVDRIKARVTEHDTFANSYWTDNLQAGFHSGNYQLCMVDNMSTGRYHKNTTLEYFIQMSFVSEKLNTSEREEITAWYNSELAKISEQETYWDEELTNLSTELNSVTTEIDSVKSLKSNAIKSVFDWGS